MSLPWLQEIDPAELLPDDTKWEEHDELTLYKQCKLRGLDGEVKKEGDALRILKGLNNDEIRWYCFPRNPGHLPRGTLQEKALASLFHSMEKQSIQVLRIEECEVPSSSRPEMVFEMSNATVRIGDEKHCSCGFKLDIAANSCKTCIHILYLERYVLKCPKELHLQDFLMEHKWKEYFANAPLAFRPRKLAKGQALKHTITDKECQLCFKEIATSSGIVGCKFCRRVAHQQCHDVYRTRKAACEGNTGCPLCCPQCPWNPSNQELKAELVPMEVKKESGMPRDRSATAEDALFSATKQKVSRLENKVRKLRDQLRGQRRRKPTSRTMTDRQYRRLVAKTGRRIENHRNNKGTMRQRNSPKKEEACVKEERQADVSGEPKTSVDQTVKEEKCSPKKEEACVKEERQADVSGEPTTPVGQTVKEEKCVKIEEESEPAVVIVKVEPRRKVKSEPVVISLL